MVKPPFVRQIWKLLSATAPPPLDFREVSDQPQALTP